MMKKFYYILLYIIILKIGPLYASPYFFFKKYMTVDGLSDNTVLCGLQDNYGFIWLGTSNGLNCYDGSSNIVYRNMPNEKSSFENNSIISLLEENQNIWIGANYGLYIYNRFSNRFSRFNVATKYGVTINSEVKKILKARNGMIWICTMGQGLFIYNPKNGYLYQNSLHSSFFCDICQDNDGKVFLSSMDGTLLCFSENGNFINSYSITNYIDNKNINCLKNINGEILMGTNNGLYHFNKSKNILGKYDFINYFGSIHCLLNYSPKEILVGTDKGLYLFNLLTKLYQRMDNPSDSRSLNDQVVNAIMWDKEGSLWVMTNSGGINYMSKQSTQFNYHSFANSDDKVLGSKKIVRPFCETKDGNIWIGTSNGLFYYNATTQNISEYEGKGLKYDIRSIIQDGHNLWIGTYSNGIRVVDLKNGKIKSYIYSKETPYSICSNNVSCIYKDKNGNIYVGTNWGLCRYNPATDKFITITAISSMTSITDILEDAYGNIWVATSNCGVLCRNVHNGSWIHYSYEKNSSTSITSNSVITLFKDSKNRMWFGTNGGGLCYFDSKTKSFINFDQDNLILPNDVIYAIEQDMQGNFWISNNIGLTKINPITKRGIQQYTVDNDLWGGQITQHSSLISSRGELFFGSIDGFYTFYPQQIYKTNFCPVYITNISFPYSSEEEKEKEKLHLDAPLYTKDKITIPYKDNSFSIHFVAVKYENPSKVYYSYMLKGVNKQWVQSTTNIATYTNLSPGKYEFLIRKLNGDGLQNSKTTSIWIFITPPWYRSNIAYFIYFVMLVLLCYYITEKTKEAIRRKYNFRIKEYQINHEKETYKSKINFFVNLMHEIRTPLSLISLPLEKMQEEKQNDTNKKYISIIHKNLNYLLDVTNQLLDFQKVESGRLSLNLKECNIKNLLNDIYNQFAGSAETKKIKLMLYLPKQSIISAIDQENVRKILVNLISNALKYAQKEIELRLISNPPNFEIWVVDDGPGIPDTEKGRIFEAFYQLNDDKIAAALGTGIGLSFAKSLAEALHGTLKVEDNISGGSKFILSLPIKKDETTKRQEIKTAVINNKQEQDEENYEPSSKDFTILFTEDNIELLNLTYDSLRKWYHILKAHNGQEALDILNKENVDVIISDIMMPEMNGIELCSKVKSDINFSHIPVILLSAKTTLESKVEGMENGADVYMEKPFSIKQLHLQIENLLQMRQAFHKWMISLPSENESKSIVGYNLTQKDYKFTEKLQNLLLERLADENFYIDSLAEQLNMSRSCFYRKIKALSGMSPNDYMKTVRMNKAAELIRQGSRISEAAEQVGFTSSSYFAKCFKAQFGVLPKDYPH